MDKTKIGKKIREFLYEENLKDEFESLSNSDSLLERGIIDSVKMLELIEFIEENFKIHIDEDDLIPENFDNINVIIDYIKQKNS